MLAQLKKDWLCLLLVIIIASFFRFAYLNKVPYGFHNDEVMNGYVGRFILENGHDLYGNRWPLLYFDNFGDYPNVIPMYLSGLFTYIFGVNEFAVRFPIALAGVITVALIYLIGRFLFKQRWVALLSALILAVLPWHLVLSRATAEGITASLFFIGGFSLAFAAIFKKSQKFFILANILLFLTYFLYPGFRLLTPLASLSLIFLAFKNKINWRYLTVLASALFFILTLLISQTVWGKGRFAQTSVFTHNQEIAGRSLRYRTGLGEGKVIQARLFHNKFLLSGLEIGRQYLSYFSPQFYLAQAGKPARYLVPEHGQIYIVILAVLALAVILQFFTPLNKKQILNIFKKNKAQYFLACLYLLFISPLSAALTLEDVPNIHRAVQMAVLLVLLIGFLLALIFKIIKNIKLKKLFILIFCLALIGESFYFWHYFTKLSGLSSIVYRNEEQRSLARVLIEKGPLYDQILVPAESLTAIHYLFYKQDFSQDLVGKFALGMKIDQLNNIYFTDSKCASEEFAALRTNSDRVLIIDRAECQIAKKYQKIGEIKYLNQANAYWLLEPVTNATD